MTARSDQRAASVPPISYPDELPISAARAEIKAAIAEHQVVVLAGETGSGKTTQLPKICLELGRGVRGLIGHTQPRRLAARSIAARISDELGTELGSTVGWKVRFTDEVSDTTLVKLMTDGVLLAEITRDRLLRRYDTIIIDEAHERSLNIDFLLGYLAGILPKRPDLKLIITSATIDPQRFADHFAELTGAPVPVLEVSGRTYPVEVRYRPVVDPDDPDADPDRDQLSAILDAVDELSTEPGQGDVLVFLSGEREIRDTAEALRGRVDERTEILPLYARLSSAEQHRVFAAHTTRRIVLATNVAETSLTVPGIRYVIDPGLARISRYSTRRKVQRLPIEAISRASADQRKGRCGRTSDGICIRLYAEDDFDTRPQFTDPEILRTNLASVILSMTALGIGDVAAFPFLDPPDRRSVADGITLLEELGALEPVPAPPSQRSSANVETSDTRPQRSSANVRLTALGRKLSAFPVDPRMARMIVEADRNGCLHEVLVIVAALSIQDPRERPTEKRPAADQAHARFADPTSDFMSLLNLWNYLGDQQKAMSGNQFRKLCGREFLHFLRLREWQDLFSQLRRATRDTGLTMSRGGADAAIHRSILSGLLSQVGLREAERDYQGVRNTRFAIWPGSALARKPPRWIMATELIETTRLFARTVARTDPETIESLASHLVKRTYGEPRWDARRGAVLATERVTLYGIPLITGRSTNYAKVDPEHARELFIRHALVEGDWDTHHKVLTANREVLEEIAALEDRARRRGLRIDDDTLFELYDQRIGQDVVSGRHFDSWWKRTRRDRPDLLTFDLAQLTDTAAAAVQIQDFPDTWRVGDTVLPLTYTFQPGTVEDGVRVDVPVGLLATMDPDPLQWTVPGHRRELITELLRKLPKPLRRNLVPIPDRVDELLPDLSPDLPILTALERAVRSRYGVLIPPESWRLDRLPAHLRPSFAIRGEDGAVLATGSDLTELRDRLAPQARASITTAAADLQRAGITSWDFGDLPPVREFIRSGHRLTAYPALVDEGDDVAIRVVDTPREQLALHRTGVRRLLIRTVGSPVAQLARRLGPREALVLRLAPHPRIEAVLADCVDAAADALIAATGGPGFSQAGFEAQVEAARGVLAERARTLLDRVLTILPLAREAADALERGRARRVPDEAMCDVTAQLAQLLHPGFVTDIGAEQLRHLPRYLSGIIARLDKLPREPARDLARQSVVVGLLGELGDLVRTAPSDGSIDPELTRLRWLIEELRVSFFAESLGTAEPVSEQRIVKAMDRVSA